MFGNLLSGLVDTEKITHNTIQEALENIAEELNCDYKDFFLTIQPINNEFDMKFYIYKKENQIPKLVREIKLSEILNTEK